MVVKELTENVAKEILSGILDRCFMDNFRDSPTRGYYIFDYDSGQIEIAYCDYLNLRKWVKGEL